MELKECRDWVVTISASYSEVQSSNIGQETSYPDWLPLQVNVGAGALN
jgi:hypothetical protein